MAAGLMHTTWVVGILRKWEWKPPMSKAFQRQSERVLRNLARRGYDIIFTTSFGYMDPTLNVAKQFPDTIFMHASGFRPMIIWVTTLHECTKLDI